MTTIEPLKKETAPEATKPIFDAITQKVGRVPNLYAVMGHSAAALGASLGNQAALEKGELSPKEVQAIMLSVSETNHCEYCLAAHTTIGKLTGFSEEETLALRAGTHNDPKLHALTNLASAITETKGHPGQEKLDAFFKAGYSKGALIEAIGWVAYKINLNYVNEIAGTPIDFPKAKPLSEAMATQS